MVSVLSRPPVLPALLIVTAIAVVAAGRSVALTAETQPPPATPTPLATDASTDGPGADPVVISGPKLLPPAPEGSHAALAARYDLPSTPDAIRGVYSTPYSFWGENWQHLVALVAETEVNAVVVDVKDEAGTLLFDVDHPYAAAGGADWRPSFEGFDERLQQLHDAGGWAIARVACFKDTLVARAHPEIAVQHADGSTWVARGGAGWLSPYRAESGDWCIDVGVAAIEAGFDEVQFDYIRYPNGGDGPVDAIEFAGAPAGLTARDRLQPANITNLLDRAADRIHEAGGWMSVDLFAQVTYNWEWHGGLTGQVLEEIAEHADYISLMIYPSHYGPGNYGLSPHPGAHPYETVWNAMQEAQMRTQGLHGRLRPWLEHFTLGHVPFTPSHVTEQVRATYENGTEGWLLWNARNSYGRAVFADTFELHSDPAFVPPARTANPSAPPGSDVEEREWPGMPPCMPYPEILQVGTGNVAGSTPPEPALAFDDERLCRGVPDGERAQLPWQERQGED